ncbi:MAG: amino acid ABC transporter substrate-binding protein [Magnetovibrio sp.]|nr:amino acid ABC transporter substrate-binding protein [Magnetovibrio sp.]
MKRAITIATGVATAALFATSAYAGTLQEVQKRGTLSCGVSTGLPGFSELDSHGNMTGLDADVCRAVAAAVLGDASKVSFKPLTAKERFTALSSGEIDMLSRNTTWTLTRDTSLGLNFTGVSYYDGQGFMVKKDLGVNSAKDLDGATVCLQAGTTTELNVSDYFREHGMKYTLVAVETSSASRSAFDSGRCDVLTTDRSQLAALRTKMADPSSVVVLPEIISKEPLGPVVRQGDDQWFNIVKWTLYALINAEEMGVTSATEDAAKTDNNPGIKRLVGTEGDMGTKLGLSADWAYNAIKQVGNYSEVFERNVGVNTPVGLARGQNALWTDGGLQYAPPVR